MAFLAPVSEESEEPFENWARFQQKKTKIKRGASLSKRKTPTIYDLMHRGTDNRLHGQTWGISLYIPT